MFFNTTIDKYNLQNKKEPLILFMLFYLPGFISQPQVFDRSLFNTAWFNIIYIITVIPQILLIIYLIGKKPVTRIPLYGISKIEKTDLLYSLFYFAGIILIIISTGIISTFIADSLFNTISEIPLWKLDNKKLIPLIFITCMVIGYSEELFFRSYLLTEFHIQGKEIYTITASSLLFALGHIYQGLLGFLGTFSIGLFLAHIFMKKRKLHTIAIAHGLYNFTVLILSSTLLE